MTYTRNTKIEVKPGYHEWLIYRDDERVMSFGVSFDECDDINSEIEFMAECLAVTVNEYLEDKELNEGIEVVLFNDEEIKQLEKAAYETLMSYYGEYEDEEIIQMAA